MAKRILNLADMQFLAALAMLGAERYRENAATFRALIDHKPNPDDFMQVSGDSARGLAEQFERQAEEAGRFAQLWDAVTDDVVIEYDPELVEDEQAAA